MVRKTMGIGDAEAGLVGCRRGSEHIRARGRDLAREFAAPVGVLDPHREKVVRDWRARASHNSRRSTNSSCARAARESWVSGQAILWRQLMDCRRIWLVLPTYGADVEGQVALAGFRASVPEPSTRRQLGTRTLATLTGSESTGGRSAPSRPSGRGVNRSRTGCGRNTRAGWTPAPCPR